ncbi:MAG TPA: prephenate dehydratase [Solirubrobacteraceae bacterium]|jgi:prephenate dehydratase|nr:prephenate dehydratase [Solirubrobacteraceae bacterium]
MPKVGYLGPAGTFSEEALYASAAPGSFEPVALATIYETVLAVRHGDVRWALVPIENSLDGSVTVTLDLLADEHGDLEIVGETPLAVRHSLIAAHEIELAAIDTVITHPQVPGQCTRFLRSELAHARIQAASSTAEAVRLVATARVPGHAALGTRLAAQIYGATVLREGVQDRDDNVTRFVWLARAEHDLAAATAPRPRPPLRTASASARWKTSLVFWGPGADSPGWLVRCLDEFAQRSINLTKIESRPRRGALGHYRFFVDLQGALAEPAVTEALQRLRALCEQARVLGSYPAAR